jgi:Family of unknown function (DUF5719)
VRNLFTGRMALGVAVLVVLGGLYGLGGIRHSIALAAGAAASPVRSVAVTSVTRACAAPGWAGSAGGEIALMAVPARTGAGQATVNRLAAAGSASGGPLLFSLARPGSVRLTGVRTDAGASASAHAGASSQQASGESITTTPVRGGVVVNATGAMAQGLEVEQIAAGGLPTASCGSPGTDFWFTGPGQHSTSKIDLFLMNPSAQTVDADVDLYTDAGPLQGPSDTGITVPPHGMVMQSLATTLRGSRSIALHVRTSAGQVVAAVQESTGAGPGAWLPPAQTPATKLVLPGLPGTPGSRQVYLAVPGIQGARINLAAVTARGSYEPTGAGGIDLPGGSAAEITLPSLGGIPAALKLTSNVPVTAVAMAVGGAQGAPGAFTAAAAPIQEQGVVADNLSAAGRVSSLVISAPAKAARVRVVETGSAGSATGSVRQLAQVVSVAAGHSVVVALNPVPGTPKGSVFAVVITPLAGSGQVYAGRVIAASGVGGALQAMLPVASALTSVPLPPVRDSVLTSAP